MTNIAFPLLAFLLPLVVSWLVAALLTRFGLTWMLDHPGARKIHTRPVPRGGGLGIYLGVVVAAVLLHGSLDDSLFGVLILGGVIVLLGLADDLRPLPWQLRLAVQTGCAIGFVVMKPPTGGWLVGAVEIFWIVGLVNAFNMLDNMDALSGGTACIAAAVTALAAAFSAAGSVQEGAILPCVMLMGGLLGFLWFNRSPARLFMGDAGSTFLGFFLGIEVLQGTGGAVDTTGAWLAALCILAAPWYDLVAVVALRLWQGKSPFHADKQHLSHRLVGLGLRPPAAVRVIHLLALASGLAGLVVLRLPGPAALLAAVQLAVCWLAVALIEYFRWFQRPKSRESTSKTGSQDPVR